MTKSRSSSKSAAEAKRSMTENARKALAMKDADRSIETRPATSNPGTGMKPLPNTDIAPSGALEQEGHRPVVERSRKAR